MQLSLDPTRASPSAKPTNMCIHSGFVTYNFVKLAKTRLLLNETKKKHRARVYDEYTSKLYVVAIVQRFEQVIADNRRGKKRDANFFDDITQPLRNFQLLFFFFSLLFAIILSDCYCNPNLCVCWKTEGNRSTYINKI